MPKKILILLLTVLPIFAFAGKVKVRIYSSSKIDQMNISFDVGKYVVKDASGTVLYDTLDMNGSIELKVVGGQIKTTINGYEVGSYATLDIVSADSSSIFCINPKGKKQRTYEGDIHVKVLKNNQFLIVNEVDFETYIAGVVQSEIYGKPDQIDIFRVQAIISRTWALRNMNKHKADGYNFCDDVHCQAYYNRCIRPEIVLGTLKSVGEILVDASGNPIDTPFHSNSGGQTANSEDVWKAAIPYLRSVPDTFSFNMKQSVWKKEVSKNSWLSYFSKKHSLNVSDSAVCNELLNFTQNERKNKIMGVPLTRIRTDFKLKSTFFSVSADGEKVIISGKGYGHGVGLSQEGAIRMVTLGHSYQEILRHYYTGATIYRDKQLVEPKYLVYVDEIEKIIEGDKKQSTAQQAPKNNLEKMYKQKEREEREEIYVEEEQDNEAEWEYDW